MKVDLHLHSTASDGQYAPEELVRMAHEAGVETMALTDHDTAAGVPQACAAGQEWGVRVIPGIELSAAEHANLHILGYGVNPAHPVLLHLCEKARLGRERHTAYICDYLAKHGVPVDLEEVRALAGNGSIGRPHFAQVLVRHGYVKTSREAFDRYLDTPEFHRIEREKPTAQSCVQAIRSAGGVPVLAHPYQLHLPDDALEAQVQTLIADGLQGIECFYPKHTPQQQAFYLHLAEKYHMYRTAGSDFHGPRVHADDRLWPVELEIGWLEQAGAARA